MKKIVSLSLAAVMLVASLFGFASVTFADETFACGDNVNAVYNENTKTLTVSGSGPMSDYSISSGFPEWANPFLYPITSIVVEEGVTSVGDFAFANMYTVKNVSLPSTGLNSIGERAFSACFGLTEISIPASVESIGRYAFRTTNDGESAKLTAINVDENNQAYCSVNGVLYDKDLTTLIQIPSSLALSTLEIPETVEIIGEYSGEQLKNVTEIIVPDAVTMIQEKAFSNSSKLEKVVINTDKIFTISTGFLDGTSATIYSFEDSYAQTFASSYGIPFVILPYCIITFIDENGDETKITEDIGTPAQEINAPQLPETQIVDGKEHKVFRWFPELSEVTHNTSYRVSYAQESHTLKDVEGTALKPTIDYPGKNADKECTICGYHEDGSVIPQLEHYTITATAVNGNAKVQGVSELGNVAVNGDVTLVATANEGYTFVGWSLNDKIVSTEETYATKAIANADYVAIYELAEAEAQFTVVFTDQYGNVYSTQTVSAGTEVVPPADPTLAGFTFAGWSMTEEEIDALTANATIVASFERVAADQYVVTVTGDCTIAGADAQTTTVDYNTKVTVNAPEGSVNGTWKVDGAAVAYGTSYTFLVGADITLTYEEDAAVTAEPTVAAVSTDRDANSHKVAFLATRSLADGYEYVTAGFVYGKNLTEDDLKLANVGEQGTGADSGVVKVGYCSTDSEQFRLSYGLKAMSGTVSAKAFLAYVDTNGETQIIYGALQTYTY